MSPRRRPLRVRNDTTLVEYGTAAGDREFPNGMGEVLRALDWNGMDGKFDIEWDQVRCFFTLFLLAHSFR